MMDASHSHLYALCAEEIHHGERSIFLEMERLMAMGGYVFMVVAESQAGLLRSKSCCPMSII